MLIFIALIASTVGLSLGLFGLGRSVARDDPTAAAVLRGWTLFLLLGAAAWFGKLGAALLAPAAVVLLGVGWWSLLKTTPRATVALLAAGSALIAALFALPFLRQPGLLAYSHWGTDQWGYISVARWLMDHSVDQLPAIDNKPGRDWIWYVLTVRDRPLIYETLALIAATFRVGAHLAYYVLPAALGSALFTALFLGGFPVATAGRFFLALGVTLQPLVLLHYQYQFLGGAVAGLLFMLLTAALLQVQAEAREGRPLFFAFAALLGVLLAGLYTIKISLVALAMVLGVFASQGALGARSGFRGLWRRRAAGVWFVAVVVLIPVAVARIRTLMPEPWITPPVHGTAGHVWAQFGALFGLLDVLPWYQPDGAPGALDPVRHNPAGSGWGVAFLAVLSALLVAQSWRWYRRFKDLAPAVICGAIAVVAWLAAPPYGSHWNVSRALPVFGPALLVTAASTALIGGRKWLAWLALGLACLPIVRAAPALWPYFAKPVNQMTAETWTHPPEGNVWGALGLAYFYEDSRKLDWSRAPECFRAMTHYMPENLRPTLPEKTPAP